MVFSQFIVQCPWSSNRTIQLTIFSLSVLDPWNFSCLTSKVVFGFQSAERVRKTNLWRSSSDSRSTLKTDKIRQPQHDAISCKQTKRFCWNTFFQNFMSSTIWIKHVSYGINGSMQRGERERSAEMKTDHLRLFILCSFSISFPLEIQEKSFSANSPCPWFALS